MCAGEGIEDIDDAHDAAVDGYLFPPQPTGVALAIEPFVKRFFNNLKSNRGELYPSCYSFIKPVRINRNRRVSRRS
jgi:hypothetical protein